MSWVKTDIALSDPSPIQEGIEYLLYNEEWIDEDFNPEGTRIGFYNGGEWLTAKWCDYHDEYHTKIEAPTHIMLIPKSPKHEREVA
jgi:hypothetical protein